MSKAFTKEPETGDVYDDLPDRPVSPHNLVTPEGLEMIEAELARLHLEHAAAQEANDRALLAKTNRDLRYWTSRRATAQVMEPPKTPRRYVSGPRSPSSRDRRRRTYRIVGQDEPTLRRARFPSVAGGSALMGKQVGDVVGAGAAEAGWSKFAHGFPQVLTIRLSSVLSCSASRA